MIDRARKRLMAVMAILLCSMSVAAQSSWEGREILQEGIRAFGNSQFREARSSFRRLAADPEYGRYHGDAYFWIGKSAMGLGELGEAARNLEHFLRQYPDHRHVPEARYQKARLLYMEGDFQEALQAFEEFIAEHPSSPFIANAYYWSGESLFALGHLDRAYDLFRTVVREYPASHRVEAARYRMSVIDLTRREEELLTLLRWSHEEYIRTLDEFRRTERTYEEAISTYQERLARLSDEDFRAELERLQAESAELKSRLSDREEEIRELQADLARVGTDAVPPREPEAVREPVTRGELERRMRAVELKERALEIKERVLDEIIRRESEGL